MKRICFTFLLMNALIITSVSAQKQFCNTNYTVDSIAYNPVLPYNMGTHLTVIADTLSAAIPIGFNFNFYGNYFSSLLISPNGFLTFDTSHALNIGVNSSNFSNTISLFEQEHEASPWVKGTISYSTIGTSPNRKFVVSYDSVFISSFSVDSAYSTGQVVLYETTGVIEMYIYYAEPDYSGIIQRIAGGNYGYSAGETGRDTTTQWIGINDGQRFTPYNLPFPVSAPICMVSVDSATNKNLVIWNKTTLGVAIDSFIIYKETTVSGVFAQIGIQPYSTFSTFIDSASNPAQKANRYRLGYVDSCSMVAGQLSDVHKTVHLSISQGIGNTWNLSWDAYEGFSFGSYYLYRGTTAFNVALLDSISSNLYSYTDLTPPVGTVYYMIEIVNPDPCTPARVAAGGGSISSSLSNIVNNRSVGIPFLIDQSSINISPNPASGQLTIHSSSLHPNEAITVSIINVLGEITQQENRGWSSDMNININTLAEGIYFLQLKSDGGSVVKKFVKE